MKSVFDRINFLHIMSALMTIFTMVYIFCITFVTLPETGKHFADMSLGFLLGTAIATIISYWFGSSQGSKDKDSTISDLSGPSPAAPYKVEPSSDQPKQVSP